jgi:hypothetical protein
MKLVLDTLQDQRGQLEAKWKKKEQTWKAME